MIEIRKLNLNFNGHEIEITVQEAEQLRDELNQLFPLPNLNKSWYSINGNNENGSLA